MGLGSVLAGALLGSWLGGLVDAGPVGALAAIVGATLGANLALLTLDITCDIATGRRVPA